MRRNALLHIIDQRDHFIDIVENGLIAPGFREEAHRLQAGKISFPGLDMGGSLLRLFDRLFCGLLQGKNAVAAGDGNGGGRIPQDSAEIKADERKTGSPWKKLCTEGRRGGIFLLYMQGEVQ